MIKYEIFAYIAYMTIVWKKEQVQEVHLVLILVSHFRLE